MNARRRKFAHEYVANGFNGVQAAFKAGYSSNYQSAQTEAWRLLRNAEIAAYVDKVVKMSRLSAADLLEKLAAIAQADVEFKSADVLKAIELLGKHEKMWTDKLEITDSDAAAILDEAIKEFGLNIPQISELTQ